MRMLACAVLAVAATAEMAGAVEDQYDRRVAEAAAGIAASRMGALRGGFDVGEKPRLVEPDAPAAAGQGGRTRAPSSPPPVWVNGLAVAVEKEPAASPEL